MYENIINDNKYDFLRENEKLKENIILLAVSGSHGYGTNTTDSDMDIRGCATLTKEDILMGQNFDKINDTATDTLIYSFNTFIAMLTKSNPNVLELLGLNEKNYIYKAPAAELLFKNKSIFFSKKCINQFRGYARGQLTLASKRKDWSKERIGKCMMHSIRAYATGIDLLNENKIITYRQKEHALLMALRNGDYLMENKLPKPEFQNILCQYASDFEKAANETQLPNEPNYKKICEIQMYVNEQIVKNIL